MRWLRRMLGTMQASDEPSALGPADMVSQVEIQPAGRSARQLIEQGWYARWREQPAVAHDLFVAAYRLACQRGDIAAQGRALIALADNALHFYPAENVDVLSVREQLSDQAIRLLRSIGDEKGVAAALRTRATIASSEHGRKLLEESLAICKRVGDTEGVVCSLERLGTHIALYGDKAEATAIKRKALELARVHGNQTMVAECLQSLAIAWDGGQSEHRTLLDEAANIYRRFGRKMDQARCFMLCAKLACDETDWQRQAQYLEKVLTIVRECAAVSTWCTCLDLLIDVVRHQGDIDKAEALERERRSLSNPYEVPREMVEEFTEALATGNSETAQAAVRKLFAQ